MLFSSAKRCVCPARGEVLLLMRVKCSANRVALVRTRSINEIKTEPRERFFNRGIFTRVHPPLSDCVTNISIHTHTHTHYFISCIPTLCTRLFIYFSIVSSRTCVCTRGHVINARNNSHERQSRDIFGINYTLERISPGSLAINYVL